MQQRQRREQVPEGSRAGRELACGCGKCGKTFVTKAGRQRVFAKDCPNRHVDRMRAQRITHPPMADGEKFDRFAAVPETPCGCGGGCGLTFRRVLGQRGRLFARNCPVQKARVKAAELAYRQRMAKAKRAREMLEGTVRQRGGPTGPHGGETRRAKMCQTCYNLPHVRKHPGCPACGLPAVPMTAKEAAFVRTVKGSLKEYDRLIDREPR